MSGRYPFNERFAVSAGFGHYGLEDIYDDSYNYWNVTLTATLAPFELQLAYLGVDDSAAEHFAEDAVGDRVAFTALWRFSSTQLGAREPQAAGPVLMSSWSPGSAAVALQSVENLNSRAVATPVTDASERELLERIARSGTRRRFARCMATTTSACRGCWRACRCAARTSKKSSTTPSGWSGPRPSEFRGASQLSTWIIGIAYRRALNALRRAKLRPVADEPFDEDSVSVGSTEEEETNQQWLALGLESLPMEQRMALELTYTLGHSCEEVAAILDCPVNTVKTRLFRARETLKQVLPELAGMSGEKS